MSLLLDTCALPWFLCNDSKLSAAARAATWEGAGKVERSKSET
jgi:PIN domain nuclease of toxin-antitoxin system